MPSDETLWIEHSGNIGRSIRWCFWEEVGDGETEDNEMRATEADQISALADLQTLIIISALASEGEQRVSQRERLISA